MNNIEKKLSNIVKNTRNVFIPSIFKEVCNIYLCLIEIFTTL